MTREEAKKFYPILQAYAEGKVIQVNYQTGGWEDCTEPLFNGKPRNYRIKPEIKYRPFKNADECWQEMLKHQPFGWTCDTFNIRDCITRVTNSGIVYEKNMMCFENVFNKVKFPDGTPFGVKIKEE